MQTACLSPNGLDTYDLPAPARRLVVGTTDGIFVLATDDAGRWTTESHVLPGHHVESVMWVPGTDNVFAGMHGSGFYRSRDACRTWSPVPTDIGNIVFTLACVPEGGNMTLYAGTEPAALFRSRDAGESWQELPALRSVPSSSRWDFPPPPHIAHVKHVTSDPRDSRILYVCVEQGALLKSLDGGESWIDLEYDDPTYRLNRDTHRIVFSPGNPDRIYLDGGDGIAMSEDAGQTWTRLATDAMRVAYPDQLFISPASDDTLFAVGGGTPPNIWRQSGNARTAIVRSDDRGRTWHHVGGGLPDGDEIQGNLEAASMIRWPGGFGFFAGSSDGEIFASVDEGATWRLIASGLPSISKGVHHANLLKGRAITLKTGAIS